MDDRSEYTYSDYAYSERAYSEYAYSEYAYSEYAYSEYVAPPAFAPPEARRGPVNPEQAPGARTVDGVAAQEAAERLPTPWALIGTAALATLAVLAWALVMLARRDSLSVEQPRIGLPAVAAEYDLVQAVDAPTVVAMLGRQLGSLGTVQGALGSAEAGLYSHGAGGPTTVVFLGFNAADSAQIETLVAQPDLNRAVASVLAGVGGSRPIGFGPGPMGGSLQCAQAVKNRQPLVGCVWADRSTLGVLLQIQPVDLQSAGSTARAFRTAAEH